MVRSYVWYYHWPKTTATTAKTDDSDASMNSLQDFGYFWARSIYDNHFGPSNWPELDAFAGHSTTAIVMNGGANATAMAEADIRAIRQLRAQNMSAILGKYPADFCTIVRHVLTL